MLTRAALRFAERAHDGQRRAGVDAPFIEHPLEVAMLLRDAGCSDVVIAAGLLHDVVENTGVGEDELTERFGADVGRLVHTVTEDASVSSYRERKQLLRDQVGDAGGDAALVYAADKISKVRELSDRVERDRRCPPAPASSSRNRLKQADELRLEHYGESLAVLQRVARDHPLVMRLADELDDCLVAVHRSATHGAT